jgi:hypothetical protein
VTRLAASQGGLARLWAELTDPGPRGDTLVFLKNHLDGIGPGCMGLLFMGVGTFVGTLVFRTPDLTGKRFWAPILICGVFVLAGFAVLRLGVSAILSRAGRDGT